MFELVPFDPKHLEELWHQPENAFLKGWIESGHAKEMAKTGFTGLVNGKVMIIGGAVTYWENRGQLWASFNEDCKEIFVPVFRGIKKFIEAQPYRRLEFHVPCDFKQGHRRALLLGFKLETERAEKYLPSGEDCSVYVRIRK